SSASASGERFPTRARPERGGSVARGGQLEPHARLLLALHAPAVGQPLHEIETPAAPPEVGLADTALEGGALVADLGVEAAVVKPGLERHPLRRPEARVEHAVR